MPSVMVKPPVICDVVIFSIMGGDDGGDFNRNKATVASTETACEERTAHPWAQDSRKVKLDRSVGPFLELLPGIDEILNTRRVNVRNGRAVENEGTKEGLRHVVGGWIYAVSRGALVPRAVNEADRTGVLATPSVSLDVIDDGRVDRGAIWVCEGLFETVDKDARRERVDLDVRVVGN
jgi:hypothetical protein